MDEPERIYRMFWKRIIAPHGLINMRQVKKELCDYYEILGEVSKVYDHITRGRISKPNTCASAVISEAEEIMQDEIRDAIQDELDYAKDN